MAAYITEFSDEQRRILINIEQHYSVWMEAERDLQKLPYGMKWSTRSGTDYLYQLIDRSGNAKSLGRRSLETEEFFSRYIQTKAELTGRKEASQVRLWETCAQYRSLRLPMIPSDAAKILREADRRHLLDGQLFVVGTNAMPAYFIEAGGRIVDAPDETDDFDMAWSASTKEQGPGVLAMLKSVDRSYTVNAGRTFQARNAKAFKFELLAAPSTINNMAKNDKPTPIALEEQEWLLLGRPISHIVVGRDGSPARLTVPDPRYFGLQKMWMAEKTDRDPLKKPKDDKQGVAILAAVKTAMPHYPMNEAFEASLPEQLQPYFLRWKNAYGSEPAAKLGW